MSSFGPVVPSHGPRPARILLLGEAPGSEESEKLRPFVGPSGWALRQMLNTVGVNIDDCFKANVFSRQPSANNLHLYGTHDSLLQCRSLGPLAANPLTYLDVAHEGELARLPEEIEECGPHVVAALGNTACWALGLGLGINSLR